MPINYEKNCIKTAVIQRNDSSSSSKKRRFSILNLTNEKRIKAVVIIYYGDQLDILFLDYVYPIYF